MCARFCLFDHNQNKIHASIFLYFFLSFFLFHSPYLQSVSSKSHVSPCFLFFHLVFLPSEIIRNQMKYQVAAAGGTQITTSIKRRIYLSLRRTYPKNMKNKTKKRKSGKETKLQSLADRQTSHFTHSHIFRHTYTRCAYTWRWTPFHPDTRIISALLPHSMACFLPSFVFTENILHSSHPIPSRFIIHIFRLSMFSFFFFLFFFIFISNTHQTFAVILQQIHLFGVATSFCWDSRHIYK